MDVDLAALPDDVDTLRRMVRALATERISLAEAKAEIERLRLIIRKLQRQQFGRRSESLDDDQLRLGFDDLDADIARVEVTLPAAVNATSQVPAESCRLPDHLEREDIAGSDGGASRWAVVASFQTTAKLNNVEPFAYLKDVLERLSEGWSQARLDELLPWNWKPVSTLN